MRCIGNQARSMVLARQHLSVRERSKVRLRARRVERAKLSEPEQFVYRVGHAFD